jgi:hypothetical protein
MLGYCEGCSKMDLHGTATLEVPTPDRARHVHRMYVELMHGFF